MEETGRINLIETPTVNDVISCGEIFYTMGHWLRFEEEYITDIFISYGSNNRHYLSLSSGIIYYSIPGKLIFRFSEEIKPLLKEHNRKLSLNKLKI